MMMTTVQHFNTLAALFGNQFMKYSTFSAQVKTWFQNRRMKHKKQLRKTQDDQKNSNDLDRSVENSSESEINEKSTEDISKTGIDADSYMIEENEDDVDIEDDICSPEHLL